MLQRVDIRLVLLQRLDALGCGARGGDCGDGRDSLRDGSAADGLLVEKGVLPVRSIDDEMNPLALDQVDDVGPPFLHLVDTLNDESGTLQHSRGAFCSDDMEAKLDVLLCKVHELRLVTIVDAKEDGAPERKGLTGRELGLGEGFAEVVGDAHDFASRFHFRARALCRLPETCSRGRREI